ncbi:hypothetical protein A7K94_0203975 [Modestobacter sp. VKM Ac-2676]|nr:hypothetical protein A7K94_0203975 [Modestobacter sp. VKM Ac-2676]
MVKCRAHWRPRHRHEHRIEARRYPDAARAADRVALLRDAGLEPVLQQPVDGELMALIGLFSDGRLHGRVQQRSPRLWPTPTGVSCRAETVPVEEDLAGQPERNVIEWVDTEGLDDALAGSPVTLSTMGRSVAEDRAYFLAAAAAGRFAAQLALFGAPPD